MSQANEQWERERARTVEFAYGIKDRVRVHDCVRSVFAGQKGVVIEARQTAEHHLFKVVFSNGADELLCSYHLEPAALEPEASAPAPIFPRVIWRDDKDPFPRRIVQTSSSDLIAEESRHRDATGAAIWSSVSMEGDWLTDALVNLALTVTRAGEVVEPNGSDGKGAQRGA